MFSDEVKFVEADFVQTTDFTFWFRDKVLGFIMSQLNSTLTTRTGTEQWTDNDHTRAIQTKLALKGVGGMLALFLIAFSPCS